MAIEIRIGPFGNKGPDGIGVYDDGEVQVWKKLEELRSSPIRLTISSME